MAATRKRIVLLGATGSIGESALRVIRTHPDRLQLVGASARQDSTGLAAICREFRATRAVLTDPAATPEANAFGPARLDLGPDALNELAALPEADLVVNAVVGASGLAPTLAALTAGKTVALANKEALVLGGALVMETARTHGARLLPVDSEHNALFQCLEAQGQRALKRVILTASGGPFRDWTRAQMVDVTPEQACQHPNWEMGRKVTVDSSTLANKGLEMIEARWLFALAPDAIDVVVHRQSIVHALVEFADGAMLAQLTPPRMTFPLQHALLYPEAAPPTDPPLDLTTAFTLDFAPPDEERFPALALARQALCDGDGAGGVYNAANEVAVHAFLENGLPYLAIPDVIAHCLSVFSPAAPTSLDAALDLDRRAREEAHAWLARKHG